MGNTVYRVELGDNYVTHDILARSFGEAFKKAKKLQAREKKEDPTLNPAQNRITSIREGVDITQV